MTFPHKQKLELTWIDKDKQAQLEPRIMIEDAGKSYGDYSNILGPAYCGFKGRNLF